MKRVAITGGIGSGKSLLLKIIQQKGYPVFSCDEIYKEVAQSQEYLNALKLVFPSVVKSGALDRAALSNLIFRDTSAREKLNKISHPLIMGALYQKMRESTGTIAFAEVPLLFEGGFEKDFDVVIVVEREKNLRIEAIKSRNHITSVEAEDRINAQFDYDNLNNQAYFQSIHAYRISNNQSIQDFETKAIEILNKIILL